jgi:hypothetical protein
MDDGALEGTMVDRIDTRPHGAVKHWPIVVLRVYAGLFFAWNGFGKISRGNFADGMEGFLNAQLANSFTFYRPFIESVVLPNKTMFAAGRSSNPSYYRIKQCSLPWLPGASWPWGWQ